ncbi:MAG TPA: aldolase/citrate lyase family protein [Streptosporangiaceae bacterium]
MQNKTLGERLTAGETLYGGWNVTGDVTAAGLLAAAGLDYVVVDLQHGAATERDLPALTAAIGRAGAVPMARVRYAHPADIGRALDLGCAGVIVPNVDSADQARAAAGACRYPPAGYRSGGGVLASPGGPLCLIMVESRAAMADLDQTLAIDGVDGVYVGPRDLSYSLGCAFSPDDAVLRPALEQIWAACRAAGKPVGVHATDGATASIYRENGCRLVNVASDVAAIARTVAAELAVVRA